MTDTVVIEDQTDDTPPAHDAPDVVVVDTGSDSGGDHDLEIGAALGALSTQVGTLTETVNSLVERVDRAESNAQYAWDMALEAQVTANDAVEVANVAEETAEETSEDVDEIIEPDREHGLWRNPVRIRRREHD